jgi:hypothetical protein
VVQEKPAGIREGTRIMATAQQAAISAALAGAMASAGVPIVYTVADTRRSVPLTAIRGHSTFERLELNGLTTLFDSVDWIFPVESLTIEGGKITPAIGDYVSIETEFGYDVFEVLAVPGEKSYRTDQSETQMRIHTKKKGR